ncbi:MAG: PDZ domain-containing protein [Cytophagales bacterium]|nr:PDZ domain-containing protein [Cytophagales bacterium]
MKACLCIVLFTLIHIKSGYSQDTLTYNISFPNAVHHEAEITFQIGDVQNRELTAIMSKSSPGRYAIHNFAMNVYNLKAYDRTASEIPIEKIKPDAWRFRDFGDSLTIKYTLYANYANGTYSGIDAKFAILNMPATLLWMDGMHQNPVKLIFHLPDTSTWKVATQLIEIDSAERVYGAPDLPYLMDSPCMLSDFEVMEFNVGDPGEINIRMAVYSDAEETELHEFVKMTKAVILEQKEVFGEFPDFTDNTYTFLCGYGPGFYGDGMEHRNSSVLSAPIALQGNKEKLIGTVSHEFFHVWNIERLRPASLEPFDFAGPNVCGELWFGEGFTNYYGDLVLCRAGLLNKDRYINSLSRSINYFLNAPGRKYGSPVYMSEMATYRDGGSRNDNNNFANTYLSYYSYGEIIALALDLSLRTGFNGVSLDDLMQAMWTKYGKTEIPYSNPDIQTTLSEVCGDEEFAKDFFERYIYGNEAPDFAALFDKTGYKLIKKNPGKSSIGFLRLEFEGDTARLLSPPLVNSAFYEAGINQGDLILAIDDQPVTSYPELNFIIGTRKVGDEINVSYSHHGRLQTGSFKLKEDNQYVLIPKEKFSIRIKEEEMTLRDAWLSPGTGD